MASSRVTWASSGMATLWTLPMTALAKYCASAMPSTTVAGPRMASPPTKTFSRFVRNSGMPLALTSMPLAVNRSLSIRSPTAAITVSQLISVNSPVGTGLRRPFSSGSPSFMTSHFNLPLTCSTGATSSRNRTPSSTASSSSSASAGIYFFVRRYTSVEVLAPARRAARAASMAVLPPPTTATWPRGTSFPAFRSRSHWITGTTLPGMSS